MTITTARNIPALTENDIDIARQSFIERHAGGRPTLYNADLAAQICALIEEGLTITAICKRDNMPKVQTVHDWKRFIPEFAASYARARRNQAAIKVDLAHDGIDSLEDNDELTMTRIRLAEVKYKAALESAKCYDREQFGPTVQVNQQITVETMADRIQRLTGGAVSELISIPAECLVIEE